MHHKLGLKYVSNQHDYFPFVTAGRINHLIPRLQVKVLAQKCIFELY